MRRLLSIASFALVFASSPNERAITDPVSVASIKHAGATSIPIEDLYFSRSVSGGAWSPDGRQIVFTTNLTGRFNLWKVDAAGGWPIQLAQSDDRQSRPIFSPDGKSILWQQDKAGDEAYDLYSISSNGGAISNLTGTPKISESGVLFGPDGRTIAVAYKPVKAAQTDIAVIDLGTKAVRNLTNEKLADRSWQVVGWSPNGKYVYGNRSNPDDTNNEVWRVDVATGSAEKLTTSKSDVAATAVSPDGKNLLITSNEKNGFDNAAVLDVVTKKLVWLTDLQWETISGDFSPDGKWAVYEVNEDGRTDIYLAPVGGGIPKKLVLPLGVNSALGVPTAFSPSGGSLLVAHQSSTQPNDYWIYDRGTGRSTQLTHSALASLDAAALPASQVVHYKSGDGTVISAFLWVPFNADRNGRNPAIVVPHGGPTGQTIDTFSRQSVALASRGYVVIAPNVRGSTGYGKTFQHMNYQDLGGGDLQDEVYAAKFLIGTGYVDPKKIGITGGSYGGYMTLMAMGKTPDVWAAGVEMYGIVDWYTMLQHEDPRLQEYEKSLLGDPVKDKAVYEAASPIKYLSSAKAPLLVLQGANDIRVPKEEAEQVVAIYQKNGRTVDAHFYPNEGHGFQKRENQIDAIRRTIEWFDKYLK
jgi:dipeptidyl aminopeptidase/acylaminoacyl peptidase